MGHFIDLLSKIAIKIIPAFIFLILAIVVAQNFDYLGGLFVSVFVQITVFAFILLIIFWPIGHILNKIHSSDLQSDLVKIWSIDIRTAKILKYSFVVVFAVFWVSLVTTILRYIEDNALL